MPGYQWNAPIGEKVEALRRKGNATRGRETYQVCQGCHKADGSGRPASSRARCCTSPNFWGEFLEGGADRDDGDVIGFDVVEEDRAEFPEIPARKRTVRIRERPDGFVCEV